LFCGKKRHCLRHILRLACTACRDALCHFGTDSFRQGGGHIGVDKAGRYRVHGHVPAGQLPGKALGQADQPCLAGGVVGLPGVAPQRHHTAQIDNAAPALAHHAAGGLLTAEKCTLQVCVQHGVKVGFGHAQDEIIPGDARVVYKDIHPAKGVHCLLKQRFAALGSGDIGLHGHGICARSAAQGNRFSGSGFAVAVVHHNIAALPGKLYAHRPSNAAAAAGDDGSADDLFFTHCSSFHAVSTASSCAGVSTEAQATPGRVFFTKPERALPGPTSRM